MLGPPDSAAIAGVYSVVVAGGLLVLGYLLVDTFLHHHADITTRLGLSLAGICTLSLILMLGHMATRGEVFSNPWLVRGPVAIAVVGLSIRKIGRRLSNGSWWLWLGIAVVVATVVWGTPIFRMLPLTSTPDTQLHNGWIRQLMNGETTPTGVITGDIPNYYPWLFHAFGALATYLMPGRNPFYALGPLQIAITAGAVLAWFALGRALVQDRIGGSVGSLLGALAGGVGFFALRGLDVVVNPRQDEGRVALAYAGDLVFTRSYNLAFHNLAPPYPRDLAFALTATYFMVLLVAIRQGGLWRFAVAGGCLGLVGLTGGEMFIASLLVTVAISFFRWGTGRLRTAAALFLPAFGLWAIWAVPMLVNYVELGGFVTITHIAPVALPAYAVVVAWGVSVPLAIAGIAVAVRSFHSDPGARFATVVAVMLGVALALAALIPAILGEGFDTLGRHHRYWPLAYLGVACLAVMGASRMRSAIRSTSVVALVGVVALAAATTSPVVASAALPSRIASAPVLVEAFERRSDSVLNAIDRDPGTGCVAAVPQEIAREVFSYTGYRLVLWTGSWFGDNRARIRWADIYERIAPDEQRIRDNRILVNGWGQPQRWRELVETYDVDIVVAPIDNARYRPFRGIPRRAAGDYIVLTVDRCGD